MSKQMKAVSTKLNFENYFTVDRIGLGGRLALLWESEVNVSIKSFSSHHIDAIVQFGNGVIWRCTGSTSTLRMLKRSTLGLY